MLYALPHSWLCALDNCLAEESAHLLYPVHFTMSRQHTVGYFQVQFARFVMYATHLCG